MRRPVGVKSNLGFSWTCFVLPPSSHCRHASIRTLEERLVSLGAHWAFSVQPVLPSVWRPCGSTLGEWNLGQAINAVTGTRLWLLSFLFLERFCFYAAAATVWQGGFTLGAALSVEKVATVV